MHRSFLLTFREKPKRSGLGFFDRDLHRPLRPLQQRVGTAAGRPCGINAVSDFLSDLVHDLLAEHRDLEFPDPGKPEDSRFLISECAITR